MGEIQETSLVALMVKNLPAVQETWLRSLCWKDPLEKRMDTHTSILVWRIPWTEEPTVHGIAGLSDWHVHFTFTHERDTGKLNNWIKMQKPTPEILPSAKDKGGWWRSGLGAEGGRQFTWSWENRCLVNECLLGQQRQGDTEWTLVFHSAEFSPPHLALIPWRLLCDSSILGTNPF